MREESGFGLGSKAEAPPTPHKMLPPGGGYMHGTCHKHKKD
jgi:hypothetical protein